MATIAKRTDNLGAPSWQAKVRRKGFPAQSKTFNTKSEAQRWAALIESEMARGMFLSRKEAERTTLGELIDRYIAEITPTHRGSSSEALRLKAMARHPIATQFVATLRPGDFATYRDGRSKGSRDEKPVKPATVHRELGLFQQVIDRAQREWGIALQDNPVRLVTRPKLHNERKRRLAEEEERFLLQVLESGGRDDGGRFHEGTRNPWIGPAVRFAIETAMRQGEIVSLVWDNIDLSAATAHLPKTKNGDSRNVPLSTRAIAILTDLPRSIDGRVFAVGQNALKLAWQRARVSARNEYERTCEELGQEPDPKFLRNLRFHDLRHEATTRLADKLPNILDLASVTGHKDLRMLKRYYHPRAEDLAKKLG